MASIPAGSPHPYSPRLLGSPAIPEQLRATIRFRLTCSSRGVIITFWVGKAPAAFERVQENELADYPLSLSRRWPLM